MRLAGAERLGRLVSTRAVAAGLRAMSRRARRTRGAVIINFHSFYAGSAQRLLKGPSVHTEVRDFERILTLMGRRFTFVTMGELVEHLHQGEPFATDVATVTMDDGYADNYELALPVLRRLGVPATIYVATGFIGRRMALPMDRVSHAFYRTRRPALSWELVAPDPLALGSEAERRRANTVVGEALKAQPGHRLAALIDELYERLEVAADFEGHPMLSWEQLRAMREAGVEVGSHGVTHVCMTRMPESEARKELARSKRDLEEGLGTRVEHFAFPNGQARDFNDALRHEARRLGYRSVASVVRGANVPGVDPPDALKRVGLVGSPERTMLYLERMMLRDLGLLRKRALPTSEGAR